MNLIEYINTLYDFVDTESLDYEHAEIIADGYANFVEPIIEAITEKPNEFLQDLLMEQQEQM
jgi:hypothetical protein